MFKQEFTYENAKVLLTDSENSTFCNAFIFQGEKGKEDLGRLIILLKLDYDTIENREVAQGLVEILKEEFYKSKGKTSEENLEASLVRANEILKELASLGKVSWVGKLNVLIACIYYNKLSLAQTGKTSSLLIRDSEISSVQPQTEPQPKSQSKNLFNGITSGELEGSDRLILSTPNLLDIFPPLKLIQILNQKNLIEARDRLQDLLFEQTGGDNISAVLISLNKKGKRAPKIVPQTPTGEKIEEKVIKDSSLDAIQRRIKARKRKRFPYSLLYVLKDFSLFLALRIGKAFFVLKPASKKLGYLIFGSSKKIIWGASNLFKKLFRKRQAKKSIPLQSIVLKIKSFPRFLSTLFAKLRFKSKEKKPSQKEYEPKPRIKFFNTRTRKFALAGALVILIALGATLFSIYQKREDRNLNSDAKEILRKAQEKRKAALDAMIYQDEEKARKLLEEAERLTGKVLGSQTQAQEEEAKNLKNEIQAEFDKINNVVRISNPNLVANIAKLNPELNPLELVNINQSLYTFCSHNNVIFRIDLENPEIVQVSPEFVNIGRMDQATTIDGDKNILFTNKDNKFALFDIQDYEIEKISATPPFDPNNFSDLASYSNKIYTLNPNQNQIVKYTRTLSGLSKGALWLENGDIEDSVSLAIDGNIYVLTANGKVLKFYSGKPADFSIQNLNPPLSSPNKIFTKTDYKNLYILDPPSKRVVVIEKEGGRILGQFISEEFVHLKDIWVDPEEKTIYILAGSKIWSFENKTP